MTNLKVFLFVSVLLLSMIVSVVNAEMSSTNYRITSTVMSGGGNLMSSTNFSLMSTLGQSGPIGNTASDNYTVETVSGLRCC